MKRIGCFLMLLLLLISCEKEKNNVVDVSEIEVKFSVTRFEKEFYNSSETELTNLKRKYPLLFPSQVIDSVWIAKIKNEDEQYLYEESQRIFGDFDDTRNDLELLFKHIKYYNPKFEPPNVITHISDLDYDYPIIYADSILFIALDMYLGKDNLVYQNFPGYLSQNYNSKRVVVDVIDDVIEQSYPKRNSRIFLNKMILEGRNLYLKERFLPNVADNLKIGYSIEKMQWAIINEINVWKYFMENEFLYSTDANLNSRFIDVAPFSKFYKKFDKDSPGQIGIWIGWQIVRSFMDNNDVSLQKLMMMGPEEIFKKSKYKPRKK